MDFTGKCFGLGGNGGGCCTSSLILGLRTVVLKAGPNVSQKWVFYLPPPHTHIYSPPLLASSSFLRLG